MQTNDPKRGIVKELIVKSSDIRDLSILGKNDNLNSSGNRSESPATNPNLRNSTPQKMSYSQVANQPDNKEVFQTNNSTV